MDDDLPWFVINLDRSPDRWEAVEQDARRLGLRCRRVAAVDGALLQPPIPGIDPALFLTCHGRPPLLGEIGCHLSHLMALEAFLATDAPHAMVLEDDAVPSAEAISLAAELVAAGAPRDWDLVKFEAHHDVGHLSLRRIQGRWRLCAIPIRSAGSAAYLVSRASAEKLVRRLSPMRLPYDVAFERGWELGLRVRALSPSPIRTRGDASTIARPGTGEGRRQASWKRRLAARSLHVISALHACAFPKAVLDLCWGGRRKEDLQTSDTHVRSDVDAG